MNCLTALSLLALAASTFANVSKTCKTYLFTGNGVSMAATSKHKILPVVYQRLIKHPLIFDIVNKKKNVSLASLPGLVWDVTSFM